MMPVSDNLPQLRDIHLPNGVSVWPLAYGWWVILGSITAFVALCYLWKYIRRKSKKLYALRLLEKLKDKNDIRSAAAMSEILRRICIYKYPSAVSLSGKAWIDFIEDHCKNKLKKQERDLLLNAPYMPEDITDFSSDDIDGLRLFCRNWIGENL